MRKRNKIKNVDIHEKTIEVRTGRIREACERYSLGANTVRMYAQQAGAVIRLGRCFLINFSVMDKFLDDLTGRDQ